MKELRWVTGGIFYCLESAEMKFFAANNTFYQLDNDLLRNRQQNAPPTVSCNFEADYNQEKE